jgi:hypothetical protein
MAMKIPNDIPNGAVTKLAKNVDIFMQECSALFGNAQGCL